MLNQPELLYFGGDLIYHSVHNLAAATQASLARLSYIGPICDVH